MEYTERQRETNRNSARKQRYGIEKEEFKRMVAEREGKCDMCHEVPAGKRKTLFIDHDHSNGRIRGLLCSSCNTGLGLLGDNIEVPLKVQQYLQSPLLPDFRKSSNKRKIYKRKLTEQLIQDDLYMWMKSFF